MTRWMLYGLGALLVLGVASALSVAAFGQFAASARGKASQALPRQTSATLLDRHIGSLTAPRPQDTGLVMLSSNLDAFVARALAARAAGRSLDLMYYIWKKDLTGRLLLGEVVTAADRGVRVRLLLDDIGVSTKDEALLALATHPRIELRLFNPTRARHSALRRGLEMALRAVSVNRRMHNKAWIADGRLAIMGGRNIGDEYFDAGEAAHFRDLDLMAMGRVVGEAETMFDAYWNSEAALPIEALAGARAQPLATLKDELRQLSRSAEAQPYLQRLREGATPLDLYTAQLHWDPQARLLADPPEKALGQAGRNGLMVELAPLLGSARQALEITSPYFIPGDEGTAALARLAGQGVAVRVLTNSLAATDVAAVHGGYAPYRPALLKGGVALYELRPAPNQVGAGYSLRGSSQASLHTKAFTVDDRLGFVGSLNFDPRSVSLNTEMGTVVENAALVAQIRQRFAKETSPDLSYTVQWQPPDGLRWQASEGGRLVQHTQEPGAPWHKRLVARVIGWLPLESQL